MLKDPRSWSYSLGAIDLRTELFQKKPNYVDSRHSGRIPSLPPTHQDQSEVVKLYLRAKDTPLRRFVQNPDHLLQEPSWEIDFQDLGGRSPISQPVRTVR